MHKTTIMRALVWKEWRESWWLLALAAVSPVAGDVIVRGRLGDSVGGILAPEFAGGDALYIFFGLVLGARLFASERAAGTAAFLHGHPLHARIIWNAKIILPVAALLLSGGSIVGLGILRAPPGAFITGPHPLFAAAYLLQTFLVGAVAFASGAFWSAFVNRPLAAWAAAAWTMILFFVLGSLLTLLIETDFHLMYQGLQALGVYSIAVATNAFSLLGALLFLYFSRRIYVKHSVD